MLNNKFLGTVACAVTLVIVMMLAGNFTYAEEKQPKGTGDSELQALELPVCPTCNSKVETHFKGKATAPEVMHCPDCKKKTTELGVYHCNKCEKEFLKCIKCLMPSKAVTKCPKCKRMLARYIKGKIESPAEFKWEMKCPDCKQKPHEWFIQHCDKCEVDFLGCPLCRKE